MLSQEDRRHGRHLLEFEGKRCMNDVNHSRDNQMAELEAVSKAHIRQMS